VSAPEPPCTLTPSRSRQLWPLRVVTGVESCGHPVEVRGIALKARHPVAVLSPAAQTGLQPELRLQAQISVTRRIPHVSACVHGQMSMLEHQYSLPANPHITSRVDSPGFGCDQLLLCAAILHERPYRLALTTYYCCNHKLHQPDPSHPGCPLFNTVCSCTCIAGCHCLCRCTFCQHANRHSCVNPPHCPAQSPAVLVLAPSWLCASAGGTWLSHCAGAGADQ
jgi:hypothetical protein